MSHSPLLLALGWIVFGGGMVLKAWQLVKGLQQLRHAGGHSTEALRQRLEQAWQRDQGWPQSRAANTEA